MPIGERETAPVNLPNEVPTGPMTVGPMTLGDVDERPKRNRKRALALVAGVVAFVVLAGGIALAAGGGDGDGGKVAADKPERKTTTTKMAPTTVAADATPPAFQITTPHHLDHVAIPTVAFAGITEPNSTLWLVGSSTTPDGPMTAGRAITVDPASGAWTTDVGLASGVNFVTFEAKDATGNPNRQTLTVYYDAPVASGGGGGGGGGTKGSGGIRGGGSTAGGSTAPSNPGSTSTNNGAAPAGGGGNSTPTGSGGTGTGTVGPPTAGNDSFTGHFYDAEWNNGWWSLIVGRNDSSPAGNGLQITNIGNPTYGRAEANNSLCDGSHYCVWYAPPCDGTYRDTFTYTTKDVVTGLTATATVSVNVTYTGDSNYADDCTG